MVFARINRSIIIIKIIINSILSFNNILVVINWAGGITMTVEKILKIFEEGYKGDDKNYYNYQ